MARLNGEDAKKVPLRGIGENSSQGMVGIFVRFVHTRA